MKSKNYSPLAFKQKAPKLVLLGPPIAVPVEPTNQTLLPLKHKAACKHKATKVSKKPEN